MHLGAMGHIRCCVPWGPGWRLPALVRLGIPEAPCDGRGEVSSSSDRSLIPAAVI